MIVLALPLCSQAALKLEQFYPSLSTPDSQNIQTMVKNNSLGGVIKFFSQWAIIAAILVSALSLLAGGVQYLLSGAKVGNVTKAKKRIYDSFIGLAILLSSFLILQFVNPQITILQLEKTSVSSGVVFFAKTAFLDKDINKGFALDSQGALMSLEEMVKQKRAFFVGGSFSDLTDISEFGDLKAVEWDPSTSEPTKVNFENFDLVALGFWGKDIDGLQVELYEERYFGIIKSVYSAQGRLNYEGKVVANTAPKTFKTINGDVKVIDLTTADAAGFFKSPVDFTDYGKPSSPKDNPQEFKQAAKKHPPLSVMVKGVGPGIYLYPKEASAGVKYLTAGAFTNLKTMNFDDQAKEIEIIRENPVTKEKKNFLAVLYSDPGFKGDGRIFFTQDAEKLKNVVPAVYFDSNFLKGEFDFGSFATDWWRNLVEFDIFSPTNNPPVNPNNNNPQETVDMVVGNVALYDPQNPGKNKTDIEGKDRYGQVKGVSSAEVFVLADPADRAVCREVLLCNQTHGKGECLSYTPQAHSVGRRDTMTLPMPWYVPVNVPVRIKGKVLNSQGKQEEKTIEFVKNIKSIFIDGNCLVGIFKRGIKFKNTTNFDSWEGPILNDYLLETFTGSVPDLSEHPIGSQCHREIDLISQRGIALAKNSSCVSAIVVFPLQ